MNHSVVVSDGEQRSALAVVRSLGTAGYRVTVTSSRAHPLAGASRYAAAVVRTPDPLSEPVGFVDAILRLRDEGRAEVVLPVTEPSVLAVLEARDRLAPAIIPFPALETFRRAADKEAVLAAAPSFGIAVPQQLVLERPEDLPRLQGELRFPVVMKPARSVAVSPEGRASLDVRHAGDLARLHRLLEAVPAFGYPVLLQQRVVGAGIGIFLLIWEGRTGAVFAHRRLREKPPSGGVSVYRESVTPEPSLVERSRALLQSLDWKGVAMIEYKVDAATGIPYLMEINGRFWGSLQLAVDAGVDFPRLLVESALGLAPAPVLSYRAGVRSRWWWGDVDQLLARLRHSRERLALPPGDPGRLASLGDFLMVRRGDRNEILRWKDPMPFLRESWNWWRGR